MRDCCHNEVTKRVLNELGVPKTGTLTDRLLLLKERHQELQRVEKAWCEVLKNFNREGFGSNSLTYNQVVDQMRQVLLQEETSHLVAYCPHCPSKVKLRERRPNGNSTCDAGHVFPSSAEVGPHRHTTTIPTHDREGHMVVGLIEATLLLDMSGKPERQVWAVTREGTATGLTNGREALVHELITVNATKSHGFGYEVWCDCHDKENKRQEQADHAASIKNQD